MVEFRSLSEIKQIFTNRKTYTSFDNVKKEERYAYYTSLFLKNGFEGLKEERHKVLFDAFRKMGIVTNLEDFINITARKYVENGGTFEEAIELLDKLLDSSIVSRNITSAITMNLAAEKIGYGDIRHNIFNTAALIEAVCTVLENRINDLEQRQKRIFEAEPSRK